MDTATDGVALGVPSEREAFLTWARANLTAGQFSNIEDSMERGESVSFAIWLGARGVAGQDGGNPK